MDSPEQRIGNLEQTVAGLKQRVEDLGVQVAAVPAVIVNVAELKLSVSHIQADLRDMTGELSGLNKMLDKRQEAALNDSRSWRRALILGSFTVLAAVIGATATVLVAVL